jgi:hypothetical protein
LFLYFFTSYFHIMDPGLKPAGPRYARTGMTKNGDRRASLAMTEDERRHPEAKPKDLFFALREAVFPIL